MNQLNAGTRILTMLLDHFIMTFAIGLVAGPGIAYDIFQSILAPEAEPKLFLGNYYLNILAFSLYFNKDIFLGRSPAKRILKFQVVNVTTNKPANALRCLIRNFTIILWPIEVVATLINPERRIGDFLAGTRLVVYDPEIHGAKFNWLLAISAILASIIFTYFVAFYPVEILTRPLE